MRANGFMNAKTATHYFALRQEIAAYSAHMAQFPALQFKFRVNQVTLAVRTPNPSNGTALQPLVSYLQLKNELNCSDAKSREKEC